MEKEQDLNNRIILNKAVFLLIMTLFMLYVLST